MKPNIMESYGYTLLAQEIEKINLRKKPYVSNTLGSILKFENIIIQLFESLQVEIDSKLAKKLAQRCYDIREFELDLVTRDRGLTIHSYEVMQIIHEVTSYLLDDLQTWWDVTIQNN